MDNERKLYSWRLWTFTFSCFTNEETTDTSFFSYQEEKRRLFETGYQGNFITRVYAFSVLVGISIFVWTSGNSLPIRKISSNIAKRSVCRYWFQNKVFMELSWPHCFYFHLSRIRSNCCWWSARIYWLLWKHLFLVCGSSSYICSTDWLLLEKSKRPVWIVSDKNNLFRNFSLLLDNNLKERFEKLQFPIGRFQYVIV